MSRLWSWVFLWNPVSHLVNSVQCCWAQCVQVWVSTYNSQANKRSSGRCVVDNVCGGALNLRELHLLWYQSRKKHCSGSRQSPRSEPRLTNHARASASAALRYHTHVAAAAAASAHHIHTTATQQHNFTVCNNLWRHVFKIKAADIQRRQENTSASTVILERRGIADESVTTAFTTSANRLWFIDDASSVTMRSIYVELQRSSIWSLSSGHQGKMGTVLAESVCGLKNLKIDLHQGYNSYGFSIRV